VSTEKNIQVVEDFFAAVGSGDKQRLLALVAEDIEWIIPGEDWPLAGTHRGHAGHDQRLNPSLLDLVVNPRTRSWARGWAGVRSGDSAQLYVLDESARKILGNRSRSNNLTISRPTANGISASKSGVKPPLFLRSKSSITRNPTVTSVNVCLRQLTVNLLICPLLIHGIMLPLSGPG
jgi:hypothetical protein